MSPRTFWLLVVLVAVTIGAIAMFADGPFPPAPDQRDRPGLTDPNFAG